MICASGTWPEAEV